uniref:J domain-containing protein n=1 Tax=Oryza punctata TaxID=4537 RepID=A0A0E0MPP7_ORYPU
MASGCNSDNSRYYDLLGVPPGADDGEIKRAYRRAAVTHHPDKGGDEETFKEVARAYQVLSDPGLREVYDVYGEDGVNGGIGAAAGFGGYDDTFDEFVETFRYLVAAGGADRAFGDVVEMLKHLVAGFAVGAAAGGGDGDKAFDEVIVGMFKNMMSGGGGKDVAGAGDAVQFVDLSLEEFYNGATRKFTLSRDVTCVRCKGTGSTLASPSMCTACNGAGYTVVSQLMRFRRRGSEPCAACGGSGEVCHGVKHCSVCGGSKVATDTTVLELVVEKGMPDGHRITFPGEADVKENGVAGDLVMVLRQKKHGKFTRKGDDLVYEHELSLAEALCGFQFVITHLDGRRLLVRSDPGAGGEVIRPGQLKAIDGEGMPVHGMPFAKGTLYVAFRVAFPGTVTPALRDAVAAAFHGAGEAAAAVAVEDGGGCEETTTRDVGEEEETKLNVKGEQSPTTRRGGDGGGGGDDHEYVHVDEEEEEEM